MAHIELGGLYIKNLTTKENQAHKIIQDEPSVIVCKTQFYAVFS